MRLSCEACADVFTLAARAKDALAAKTKAEEELRACVLQLDHTIVEEQVRPRAAHNMQQHAAYE